MWCVENMKTLLIIMSGLPATGKSTVVETMTKQYERFGKKVHVYSTDKFIPYGEMAKGLIDEDFSVLYESAETLANHSLRNALLKDIDIIIWDQTNTSKKKRDQIITKMKQMISDSFDVHYWAILPPRGEKEVAEWNRRLDARTEKNVPRAIIQNMAKRYQIPKLETGELTCYYVDIFGLMTTQHPSLFEEDEN